MQLTALIHRDEDGGYWAEVQELPGCITQGDSIEELEANLAEVAEMFVEGLIDDYVDSLAEKPIFDPPDFKWKMDVFFKRLGTGGKDPAKAQEK
jgi:predicted RNase H-like HicB family nuclease